ncbi:methyltransferase domain-containing protein [Congregibacter variabilis]|uniref:Methyltransferase domain-containing protein n=1 Tax=Congregibacter variabilis TaxID=3081200 RepID=A0ABZ0HYI3_9GAMM|nr:methyltransferase domain-containing protein [Congregibacter sp. IMCC43200]
MISFSDLLSLSTADFELPSDVSGCRLFEAQGYRWLCSSSGAIQSALCISDPSALVLANHRAMMLAALLPQRVSSVLDLGSGGGGFLRHLRAWKPAPRLSGVEMSGEMLNAAREYFSLPEQQLIYVGDAIDFIGRDRAHYDLVLCDLFCDRAAPEALQDELFFATLARRLNEGGAIALNTLPDSAGALVDIVNAAQQHFAGVGIVQMSELGNVLLFLQADALADSETLGARLAQSVYKDDADVAQALAALRRLER